MIGSLGYVNVIVDDNCYRVDGTIRVKRAWKERLRRRFWVAYKELPNIIPTSYFAKDINTIVCHSSIKDAIEEEIEKLI